MDKVISTRPVFAIKKLLDKYRTAFGDIATRFVALDEVTDIRAKYRNDPYRRKIATYGSRFCNMYNQLDYWYKAYRSDNTNTRAKNQMVLWSIELKSSGARNLNHYLND